MEASLSLVLSSFKEMRKSPLTGLTTGEFDALRVRSPPFTGPLTEVSALVAASAYDDTQLQQDISTNAATLTTNAAAISTNAAALTTQAAAISANAAAIVTKADDATTTVALGNKADTTALTAGLATKADAAAMTAALALKCDDSRVLSDVPQNAVFTDTPLNV